MKNVIFLIAIGLLASCSSTPDGREAAQSIDSAGIAQHVAILSSDDFQGRKPFTDGEKKTIEYLRNQLTSMGIRPGNGDSYFQEVPMVEIRHLPFTTATIAHPSKSLKLKYGDDIAVRTTRAEEEIVVHASPVVFAGYGIVAPEYGWNDYAGLDVKGKTVVVLVNDPGFATKDSTLFKGNTMTYYGRWTYKYEEAARQGAAGCLIVHETAAAGYPWGVVQNGWSGSKLFLKTDGPSHACAVEGWIPQATAEQLLKTEGHEYAALTASAARRGFRPLELKSTFSISWKNELKESVSHNVIGRKPGTDRGDEVIVYTAHWDHFGIGRAVDGDSIYNGAVDNASGTAVVLELARAFSQTQTSRSVVFLLVTAEEQGLLGSQYYTEHPIFPLQKTVAAVNIDALAPLGKMKDVTAVGYGQSDLDELVHELASAQGRYVLADPHPEKGFYFRSDHFNFARHGVPAAYVSGDYEHAMHGIEWVQEKQKLYTSKHYHQPSDEFHPAEWNFDGIVDDARLFFAIGFRLATSSSFPQWKDGSEFKAVRDAMMKP